MVVAVRLAVGRNVDELRPITVIAEASAQPLSKELAATEQVLEGHRLRNRTIVEKHGDALAARKGNSIRTGWVNAAGPMVFPALFADLPHATRLIRREHGVFDAMLCHDRETLEVDG